MVFLNRKVVTQDCLLSLPEWGPSSQDPKHSRFNVFPLSSLSNSRLNQLGSLQSKRSASRLHPSSSLPYNSLCLLRSSLKGCHSSHSSNLRLLSSSNKLLSLSSSSSLFPSPNTSR